MLTGPSWRGAARRYYKFYEFGESKSLPLFLFVVVIVCKLLSIECAIGRRPPLLPCIGLVTCVACKSKSTRTRLKQVWAGQAGIWLACLKLFFVSWIYFTNFSCLFHSLFFGSEMRVQYCLIGCNQQRLLCVRAVYFSADMLATRKGCGPVAVLVQSEWHLGWSWVVIS